MSGWQLIDQLLRYPPSWAIALAVAVLVAHVMNTTGNIVARLSTTPSLFEVLELFMVVTLAILTVKSFYWDTVKGGGALHEWYEHPLVMLAILLITTLASMFGYIKFLQFLLLATHKDLRKNKSK